MAFDNHPRPDGITLTKADDVAPLCPYCNAEIKTILYKEIYGTFGRRFLYFCPDCRKTLGISHRKGLLMG